MGLNKQAKVLTKHQQSAMLSFLGGTRHPDRNKLIFLLSVRAGLRAKEIACITWSMVTDAQGVVTDNIKLQNSASKGSSGGVIWLNSELKQTLVEYRQQCKPANSSDRIVRTERGGNTSAQVIVNMFQCWYTKLGFDGCSSHSGRRTFITNASRKISTVGGSIRDVQLLARHSSLAMTQRYIEADVDAQKKVVQMV
jgi:integrase/recombinase XerD